ncbi:bifunctional adenosylcobinamide kinase/adenosylcobinamide-phosphate guanylyltransferase [Thermosulfurimonas marina]|uniref:Adenosylcobinamide kinase n=1 Tax=Thermosulfurimonas marina TaxID=2047767 RepID=A0A6H1WRW8_9BACT|nr:bifunctional adenosylcobinamide kinase/adenosylcobinamide-phosphate guanylyltransferase [Thermosulfurimonas marina]QJA05967.1 bifunctional adenosylcobinamide kinase/adenosylcobinamide-phosphate guanylyltransferase [Thermosulfurimonas marina]
MRTLILGGAASGKSRLALELARKGPPPRVFVATAEPLDAEMAEKIARHRKERGPDFETLEVPLALAETLEGFSEGTVVVDCLTVWLGNLFHYRRDPEAEIRRLLSAVEKFPGRLILVSNEVGLSPVAPDPALRRFVNLLGRLNQELASRVEEVRLVVAGRSLSLKPGPDKY